MSRISTVFSLFAAVGLLASCGGESEFAGTEPDVRSAPMAQLSAGGGIAGFDFYIDIESVRTRVGSLIVTNGAYNSAAGYDDNREYWRWEADVLDDIETGAIDEIEVDVFDTSETYDSTITANFESGTGTWTDWVVNRSFTLNKTAQALWNNPANGVILYELEAAAWGGESGTITYYHVMDFSGNLGYPEMSWLIAQNDYDAWVDSELGDEDTGEIWEVRLTSNTVFENVALGVGYELTTDPIEEE